MKLKIPIWLSTDFADFTDGRPEWSFRSPGNVSLQVGAQPGPNLSASSAPSADLNGFVGVNSR